MIAVYYKTRNCFARAKCKNFQVTVDGTFNYNLIIKL
jgi:hypothetical protein